MSPSIEPYALAIPFGFVLLAAVLLWGILGSKGYWPLKMMAITAVMYFGVSLWYSMNTYLGWPSRADMPPKYMVYWAFVQEPSKVDNTPGAIYFWVRELEKEEKNPWLYALQYQGDNKDPRVFRADYSRELHQQVQQMTQGIKKGQVFIGGKNAPKGKGGKGKGKGEGKPGHGRGHGPGYKGDSGKKETGTGSFSFSHKSKDMYIYPLPPPKIPGKMNQN